METHMTLGGGGIKTDAVVRHLKFDARRRP
jgi:hypothetical protein